MVVEVYEGWRSHEVVVEVWEVYEVVGMAGWRHEVVVKV